MLQRILAALTGASLTLATVPAYALSVNVDSSTDATVSSETQVDVRRPFAPILPFRVRAEERVAADADIKVTPTVSPRPVKVQPPVDASVETDVTAKTDAVVPIDTQYHPLQRVMMMLKGIVNRVHVFARRQCMKPVMTSADFTTSDEAAKCMAKIGLDIKTRFNAMVDATFGL